MVAPYCNSFSSQLPASAFCSGSIRGHETRARDCRRASSSASPLLPAQAPRPAATMKALVGGTLVDGFAGPPIQNSVILIDGDKISAVGQVGSLAVPAGAEVISTEGMTVLPGLWDMHVHTMIVGHADYDHWDKAYPPQFESVIMPAAAKQLLMAGVTSARDLGGPLEASISVRDRINAGKIPGATLYVSGPFIQHAPYPNTEAYRWGVNGTGRRPRQGEADRRRRRRRHQADRPGPDDDGRGARGRRRGAQARQAGRRPLASARGNPPRPRRRRGLLRAHGPRHRARVSGRRHRDDQASAPRR